MSIIIERAKQMRDALNKINFTGQPDAIVSLPMQAFDEWKPDKQYKKGSVLAHSDGLKYLVMQDVPSQAHYPPGMANGATLALYQPYSDASPKEWIYGEYCMRGWLRQDTNGKMYRLNADSAGANIYPPSMVPALWVLENN